VRNERPGGVEHRRVLDGIRTNPHRIRVANRATVKKTYNLPSELVRRAKRVLKARTETEAIVISLEDAVFMSDVEKAVRSASHALPKFRPLR
jgi:hypothetical protein